MNIGANKGLGIEVGLVGYCLFGFLGAVRMVYRMFRYGRYFFGSFDGYLRRGFRFSVFLLR